MEIGKILCGRKIHLPVLSLGMGTWSGDIKLEEIQRKIVNDNIKLI